MARTKRDGAPRRAAAYAAAACVGAWCSAVSAQSTPPAPPPTGVALAWSAPADAGCPGAAYVEARLSRLMRGASVVVAPTGAPASFTAAASVSQRAPDAPLTLTLRTTAPDGAAGERTLESTNCRQLADAAALIVALAVAPDRVALPDDEPPAPSPPAPRAAPAPQPAPRAVPARPRVAPAFAPRRAAPPAVPSVRFVVRAGLEFEGGSLPVPELRPAAALGVAGRVWRAELAGSVGNPQLAQDEFGFRARVVRPWALEARGCAGPPAPAQGVVTTELAGCVGFELGWIDGEGLGPTGLRGGAVVAAVLARAAASWVVWRWFAVRLEMAAGANVVRPDLVVVGFPASRVHQIGLWTGRFGVGLEARFP